jgi:hypothetical protein
MRTLRTVLFGSAMTLGLMAATPSIAEAKTRLVILPIKDARNVGTATEYSRFNCGYFVSCVSNYTEMNDNDIGAGIFARYPDQWVAFGHNNIGEVSAVNWSQATRVNEVYLVYGLQATGGQACTQFTVTAYDGISNPIGTASTVCQVPSDNGMTHRMNITAPGGTAWTPAKLNRTVFETAVNRRTTSGPKGYVAQVFIRVSYEAP